MTQRLPDYKGLTLPQLRTFCEVARAGSMSAAAEKLGIAQPTVWKQVHSLESHLGMSLLESHARGCRLTEQGEVLYRMAVLLVTEFDSLPDRFHSAAGSHMQRLRVAATPRPIDEELLPCVAEFKRRRPLVRLIVKQVTTRHNVIRAIHAGDADLGLVSQRPEQFTGELDAQPVYELEPVLLVPPGHPLARRKFRLEDLANYPLLNARDLYSNWGVAAALERAGVFNHPEQQMELEMARSIRMYVRNNMGIGIVVRPAHGKPLDELIERPLGHLFGQHMLMYAYHRPWKTANVEILDFIQVVRDVLGKGLKL